MSEILQESFDLILDTEMFQIVHSLSLLASAGGSCMAELLGSCNTFFFSTKSSLILFALRPNGEALRGRKYQLPAPGAPHT